MNKMNYENLEGSTEEFDGAITIKETHQKVVFWDIDGTLASYRYNNHLSDPNGTNNGQSLEEIQSGVFLRRKPSRFMQKVLKTCQSKQNIIMGHCLNTKEQSDKLLWLSKHYPNMSDILLTYEDKPKYLTILEYCKINNIDLDDVIFVDDVLDFLKLAEKNGITSYHISSFLDWDYQFDN